MGGWLSKKGGTKDEGGKEGVVKLRKEIKNPFVFTRTRYADLCADYYMYMYITALFCFYTKSLSREA